MIKVDLHGIKHEDVSRILIRAIENNWGKDSCIEVITGNSSQMKDLVKSVALEYNLECEDGIRNNGYLLIFI